MKILVFASKNVGLKCIKYLVINKFNFDLVTTAENIDIVSYAQENKLQYRFYEEEFSIKTKYDWLLNLWSPFILKKSFLDKFKYKLNIHPSYSPYCLGNDNAAWTIRNRCKAGVSLLEMTEKIDEGDIWIQKEVEYKYPIKGHELHDNLEKESINIFCNNWDDIFNGKIQLKKVPNIQMKYTRADTNNDRLIISNKEVEKFINKVLAHDFSPNFNAEIEMNKKRYKVKIELEEV